ncbi:hypothetical protein K9B35_10100 [Sphingomonas sp. R647]|uniref:hypothetical protein n=1 Tax=Sphingomonas sp. R647 TaxID=2875233 RepID=UPI001CD1CB8B|nr:hypothetical protein [Sphingomonas sp. R647]MCA1198320.1 hypothetical protein [Sphingomonas sp. R647]
MQRSSLILAASILIGALLILSAVQQWQYLDRGYTLAVSIGEGPASISHINFPTWRKLASLPIIGFALLAIALFAAKHRRALLLAWTAFGGALILGIYDLREFGLIGSPTSLWTLLPLLGPALAIRVGTRRDRTARSG